MSEETVAPNNGRGAPTSGCLILGAILGVFGGLALLYALVGNYQTRVIDGFTQDDPSNIATLTPSGAQSEAALAKLAKISDSVKAGKSERIVFTAEDLNVLIAELEVAKDFRGNTSVKSIRSQGLVVEMSQPMKKGIFKKGFRYLNADFVLEPELRKRTVAFKVRDIRPKVGEIPQPFIDNYTVIDFFKLDPDIEAIKENISSLAAVYTEADQLVIETKVVDLDE